MIMTKNIVGESSGTVTFLNVWKALAPSIFEASNMLCEIPDKADKKITILYPINFQTDTIISAIIAKCVS